MTLTDASLRTLFYVLFFTILTLMALSYAYASSVAPGAAADGAPARDAGGTLVRSTGGGANAQPQNPLIAERWQTRPLVVVAPAANDPLLRGVTDTLDQPAGRAAFDDRDMVLFTVVDGDGRREGRRLSADQTRALLRALDLPEDGKPATLVLVGKDGGAKLAQRGRADLQAVFAEIDGMPMRQNGR